MYKEHVKNRRPKDPYQTCASDEPSQTANSNQSNATNQSKNESPVDS